MSQKNSFISMLEQIAVLNKNSVEIISKLSDVVGTKDSNISVNYLNQDGTNSSYQLPSVGFLKKEIDIANSNIKKLSNLDEETSVVISDGITSKKIKSIELNREIDQISTMDLITDFNQKKNWFFDSMLNPLLSVEINLDDKIDSSCSRVLSRRYIIFFEKDSSGVITTAGQKSKTEFENIFIYNNSIKIKDFETWLHSPTNTGVIAKDENQYIDEQTFDLAYKEIDYKGNFSVIKYDKDTINNKLFYQLDTLTYYDKQGNTKILAIGDILATTNKKSYTKWRITEVNVSASLFRITLERIEGYDPVAIGATLEFYSPLTTNNKINVSIGFDEYNIIFLKPINTDTGVIGSTWGNGVGFYTNDLTLDTDKNVGMSDFYVKSVYDYGVVLKDLVIKTIPVGIGVPPNIPRPIVENFKVVQINKHLTDTENFQQLQDLNALKSTSQSKINTLDIAIESKSAVLSTNLTEAERNQVVNELQTLKNDYASETAYFASIVSQITNSLEKSSEDAKFHIRGFWEVPDGIWRNGVKQEINAFEIQWRYGSKYGSQNITEGFEMTKENAIPSEGETDVIKTTGYFSEWLSKKTAIRERVYDEVTSKWIWAVEDISNPDTQNINSLDIGIKQSEKVEIRICSISEVGFPDTPFKSRWSNIMTIEFPDELNNVLETTDTIINEAKLNQTQVNFQNTLDTKGISPHVQDSYYINDLYVAHIDQNIGTSFKDKFGKSLSLYDYLIEMSKKIESLEEIITQAKGELKVTLFRGTQETPISNGAVLTNVIECQDYMTIVPGVGTSDEITFKNDVYMISDFYLKFENIAQTNELSLLTNIITEIEAEYAYSTGDMKKPSYINQNSQIITQNDNQFLWNLPKAVVNGNDQYIYDNTNLETNSTGAAVNTDYINQYIETNDYEILDNQYWYYPGASGYDVNTSPHVFCGTLHSQIDGDSYFDSTTITTNNLVDDNKDKVHFIDGKKDVIIPLNIYFKPDGYASTNTDTTLTKNMTPLQRYKNIRFMVRPENMARNFEFTIEFNLKRHKQYTSNSSIVVY